jgi:hypothetical protein
MSQCKFRMCRCLPLFLKLTTVCGVSCMISSERLFLHHMRVMCIVLLAGPHPRVVQNFWQVLPVSVRPCYAVAENLGGRGGATAPLFIWDFTEEVVSCHAWVIIACMKTSSSAHFQITKYQKVKIKCIRFMVFEIVASSYIPSPVATCCLCPCHA